MELVRMCVLTVGSPPLLVATRDGAGPVGFDSSPLLFQGADVY